MKVSTRTGRLICKCGKGYACEDKASAYFGSCKLCYLRSLTRAELRAIGEKRP